MVSYLYKAYPSGVIVRTIQLRPRYYNVPPVTEIGGDIYDRTTVSDV